MKTLVTGASGFIGRHLVAELRAGGGSLILFSRGNGDTTAGEPAGHERGRRGRRVPPDVDDGVERRLGDIRNPAEVDAALEGCDRVYHLAACAQGWARNPAEFVQCNVEGLRNLLRSARRRRVHRVVHVSSCVSLGPSCGTPVDEQAFRSTEPLTCYELSKVLGDEAVREARQEGLDVVTVFPTRVYGPGVLSEANSATRMLALYLQGRWRWLLGPGDAIGNYAFVTDVARGLIRAMDSAPAGGRYILGGWNLGSRAFLERAAGIAGRRRRLVAVPVPLAEVIAAVEVGRARLSQHHPLITPGWVRTFSRDWAFSSARAVRDLGYRITPLDEALALTLAWLRAQGGTRESAP